MKSSSLYLVTYLVLTKDFYLLPNVSFFTLVIISFYRKKFICNKLKKNSFKFSCLFYLFFDHLSFKHTYAHSHTQEREIERVVEGERQRDRERDPFDFSLSPFLQSLCLQRLPLDVQCWANFFSEPQRLCSLCYTHHTSNWKTIVIQIIVFYT